MKPTTLLWLIPLLLLVALGIGSLVTWIVMSYKTFPNRIMPGDRYQVNGRTYQVPALPHMTYKSSEVPTMDKPVPMLDPQLLEDLEALMKDSFATLKEAGVDFWVTGGSLIAAVLWESPSLVYDDDIDISVKFADREYLWSPQFAALLAQRGLETFYLRGASLNYATREGAAVRIRRQGTVVPTMDIFFTTQLEDGRWGKVNSWNGSALHINPKETWEADWLFPLQHKELGGGDIQCPVGAQPEKMLDLQYGPGWKECIKSPQPLTMSHQFVFKFTNFFRVWRVGEVASKGSPREWTRAAFETTQSSSPWEDEEIGSVS